MKNRVNFIKGLIVSTLFVLNIFIFSTENANAQVPSLFGNTTYNKTIPNCSLRKEYNYFMNQWTTNEVCNPTVLVLESAPKQVANYNQNVTGNYYTASIPNYSYNKVSYTPSYSGYYTNNSGTGYSASGYLLSSFGGYSYPGVTNSLYYYTPSLSGATYNWGNGYYNKYYDFYGDYDYGYYGSTGGGGYKYSYDDNSYGGGGYKSSEGTSGYYGDQSLNSGGYYDDQKSSSNGYYGDQYNSGNYNDQSSYGYYSDQSTGYNGNYGDQLSSSGGYYLDQTSSYGGNYEDGY